MKSSSVQQITSDYLPSLIHDNLRLSDIVYRPVAELTGYHRRLKAHSDDTITALQASLRAFGMVSPLPIDRHGVVIDGEALLEAARRMGMRTVPTVTVDHLSPDQVRLLRLALKKLALRSDWNQADLRLELGELLVLDDELSLDVTGFTMVEVDGILSDSDDTVSEATLPEPLHPGPAVAIRDVTLRGEIVLDGFLGSGTTLVAAERTGRVCRGIELDPLYVDCIIRRWEKLTGLDARLGSDGSTFAEVTVTRAELTAAPRTIPTPRVRVRTSVA